MLLLGYRPEETRDTQMCHDAMVENHWVRLTGKKLQITDLFPSRNFYENFELRLDVLKNAMLLCNQPYMRFAEVEAIILVQCQIRLCRYPHQWMIPKNSKLLRTSYDVSTYYET